MLLTEESHPADSLQLATRFSLYAKVLQNLRRWPEARQWQERALAIKLKHWAADDPRLASLYNDLALALKGEGNFAAALDRMRQSIAIRPPDHPQAATSFHNLSTICHAAGDRAGAVEWNDRAWALVADRPTSDKTRGNVERSRARLRAAEP